MNKINKILGLLLGLVFLPSLLFASGLESIQLEYTYDQNPTQSSDWQPAEGTYEDGFTVYHEDKGEDWLYFRAIGSYESSEVYKYTNPGYSNDDSVNNSNVVFDLVSEQGSPRMIDRYCDRLYDTLGAPECTSNDGLYLRMWQDLGKAGVSYDSKIEYTRKDDPDEKTSIVLLPESERPSEPTRSGGGINLTQKAYDKYGEDVSQELFKLYREYEDYSSETKLVHWKNQNRVSFVEKVGERSWMPIKTFNLPQEDE